MRSEHRMIILVEFQINLRIICIPKMFLQVFEYFLEPVLLLSSEIQREIAVSHHVAWRNQTMCPSSSPIFRNARLPRLRTRKLFLFILRRGSCTYPAG